jgi:hypothetical protein
MSTHANIMSKLRLSKGLVLVCGLLLLTTLAVAYTVRTAGKSAMRSPELAAMNAPRVAQQGAYAYRRTLTNISAPPVPNDSYTTAGNHTWTAPTGVTSVTVECWGAGGGGGASAGGGGGGGAYSLQSVSVTPGNNYSLSVGSGGAGAANGTGDGGSNGGDSSFASQVLAKGGTGGGGYVQPGGAGGSSSAGTGSTKYSGGTGGQYDGGRGGGGGGSSAGTAANGNNAGTPPTGATAPSGGGAGGNGGVTTGGAAGSTPGGGGGGGGANSSDCAGGNGAAGKVVITYSSSGGVFINVAEFGAVGDGVTDNKNAINNAIAAAGPNSVVKFGPGKFITTGDLNSPGAGTTIRGEGPGVTIIKRKTNDGTGLPIIRFDNPNITFENLTIDGNCGTASTTGAHTQTYGCSNQSNLATGGELYVSVGGAYMTMDNVEIVNAAAFGINLGASNFRGRRLKLTGYGQTNPAVGPVVGLYAGPEGSNTTITDITIENSTFSYWRFNAILFHNGANSSNRVYGALVANSTFIGNSTDSVEGCNPAATDPMECTTGGQIDNGSAVGAQFIGNRFSPGTSHATQAWGLEMQAGSIVVGNYLEGYDHKAACFYVNNGSHYVIQGNICKNFGTGIIVNEGLGSTDYLQVTGNDLTDNSSAISITSTGTHNSIMNNAGGGPVFNSGSGAPSGSCINGSMFSRTDGTGTSLYGCKNSAWVALN